MAKAIINMFLILFLLLPINTLWAQHITIEPYYEKNVFGNQFGGMIARKINNGPQIGLFYQASFTRVLEKKINYEFAGIYLGLPVYSASKLTLSASLRGGLANTHFILVVPAVETRFDIYHFLSLSSVLAIRAGAPAIGAKLMLKVL